MTTYVQSTNFATKDALASGNPLKIVRGSEINTEFNNIALAINGNTTSDQLTYTPAGTGAVPTTVQAKLRESVSVKDFGAVGDGVADDTAAMQAAITYARTNKKALRIPAGNYSYSTSFTGLNTSGLTIVGDGSELTTLQYTGSAEALRIDGSGLFIQDFYIEGISIKGNANTTSIFYLRDVARSVFKDINVYEANNTSGIGFDFRGVQLNYFEGLHCSQERQAMTSPPYIGLQMVVSSMLLSCTNNIFHWCYTEGGGAPNSMKIGMRLYEADQNIFIGGSSESCLTYGVTTGVISKFNTFINVGFENLGATADVADAGITNKFINCYSSERFIAQGRQCSIEGGYFERIQIDAGANRTSVKDVTVNNWATGVGGFFDNGTATDWARIYDVDTSSFIYPRKDRSSITVTASPFTWSNTTGGFVEVILQTGTMSQIRIFRGTDNWLNPTSAPGKHLLAPNDAIEITYSVSPSMSYLPQRGFNG